MTFDEFRQQVEAAQSEPAQDYSAPAQNDYSQDYNQYGQEDYSSNGSDYDDSASDYESFEDFKREVEEAQKPQYSVQEQAQQANGGQSFLDAALANYMGQGQGQAQQQPAQPEAPTAQVTPKKASEIQSTPERDALIEEYKKIQNSNAIPAVRRRDEIRAELDRIDQELGNGKMDHTFSDRTASVIGGSVKGWGADMMNAAGTVVRGMGETSASANPALLRAQGLSDAEIKAELERASTQNKGQRMTDFGTSVQEKSDKLAQSSAEDINRAKNGTSGLGRFGIDIASNAVQMGMDGLAAVLTGGGSLAAMGARSLGGAAREARQEGATTGQQLAYGAVRGGIEMATEKMFDGLAGIYGAGQADDMIESLIGKMTRGGTDAERTALRVFFSGLGEAAEEGASGITEPITKAIYQGADALKGYNKEQAVDTLYSMLVGMAMGGAGGTVNILNGNNARSNAQIRENLQGEDVQSGTQGSAEEATAQPKTGADILSEAAKDAQGTAQETDNPMQQAFLESVGLDNSTQQGAAPEADTQIPTQEDTQPLTQPITQEDTQEGTQETAQEFTQEEAQEDTQEPTPPPTGRERSWSGPEVRTQSNLNQQLTEEEMARDDLNPENDTHTQHHDTEVNAFAQSRIAEQGQEAVRDELLARDPKDWDDVDVRTAQLVIERELDNARRLTGVDQDAAYKRIAELKKAYNQQGTEAGRALRQRQKFGGTKAEIVSEAANTLYGDANKGKLRKLSPEQKTTLMGQIEGLSTKLSQAQPGDTASIKSIIMEAAKARNTNALLDKSQTKLGKVIDAVAKMEGGEDFLRQIATTQIRSIASDQIQKSGWDKAKAIRYMFMLSNPATASRNVGANTVFGNIVDAISSNMSSPVDALMSMATGKRTVANERLSKEGLKGSIEAGLKSWLEVSLDAEAEENTYAYKEIKGRTFKSNSSSFVERFLSALERNQGYQLKTTDQIAKGGIEAETRRNLTKKGVDAETADALAKEEAKYRTLQNESTMSDLAVKLRDIGNTIGIKGERDANGKRKTKYGLGDDILPFAQVPANVVQTELDLNPLSIIPAMGKVFSVMAHGENATAAEQRAAAKAVGHAVNGTAIVASAVLMSAKGVLRYSNEEDRDLKQLNKAQGKSGLQINFSGAARLFTGGDPTPKEGDKWGNIGWIPQLNSLFIIGNMIYDDYKDMPEHKELSDWAALGGKAAKNSLKGIYESILEFPAVSTITSMYNAYRYANIPEGATEEQEKAIRWGSAVADKAANTASSFLIPNAMRATAAGLDDTERNLYTAQNRVAQAVDSFKAGIPDNPFIPKKYTRGSLPELTDNFGNPIKNEGGVQQFLNKTVLPGAITTEKKNAVLDEVDRVARASGNVDAVPDKNGIYSITYKGDKIKLSPSERDAYHRYAGKKSEDYIESFINSKAYASMTDDQRAETMAALNKQAKSEANKYYLEKIGKPATDWLTDGSKTYTAVNKTNIANYFSYETMLKSAIEDRDYEQIDKLVGWYGGMNKNLQTVLSERDENGLKQLLKWNEAGLSSKLYTTFDAAAEESMNSLGKSSKQSAAVQLDALANMNTSEAEKLKIINSLDGFASQTVVGVYKVLSDYGLSSKQINDFWTDSQNWVYKNSGYNEKAEKQELLSNLEAAQAISQIPGLSEAQRSAIYNEIKKYASTKDSDWGKYSYQDELNYLAGGKAYQQFGESKQQQSRIPQKIQKTGNNLYDAVSNLQAETPPQNLSELWQYYQRTGR